MGIVLVGVVLVGNCPSGGIVLVGNCPSGELSWWEIVLVGSCPGGELSVWESSGWNCPVGSCPRTMAFNVQEMPFSYTNKKIKKICTLPPLCHFSPSVRVGIVR